MYGLVWINSKTQSELMTAGSDGTVKFWDIRMFEKLVRSSEEKSHLFSFPTR